MAIVKFKNQSGTTYVYEQHYEIEADGRRHLKRKLIGKIDEETGEIVPTGKRGRAKQNTEVDKHKEKILNDILTSTKDYKTKYLSCRDKLDICMLQLQNEKNTTKILRDEIKILKTELKKHEKNIEKVINIFSN